MAPMIKEFGVDDSEIASLIVLASIATLVIVVSMAVFVLVCACCGGGGQNREDEKRKGSHTGPENEPRSPIEQPASEKREKLPETSNSTTKVSTVGSTGSSGELKPSSLILSKKEGPPSNKAAATSSLKLQQQQQPIAKTATGSPTATLVSKSRIEPWTSRDRQTDTATFLTTQTSVVTGATNTPGSLPTGVEPTYPLSQAVEFENPAYDTIGPEFDDPFHYQQVHTEPKPLVVAQLVQPSGRQHSIKDDKSKPTSSGKSPSSAAAAKAPSVDTKSSAVSAKRSTLGQVSVAYSKTQASLPPSISRPTTAPMSTAKTGSGVGASLPSTTAAATDRSKFGKG